MPSMCLRAVWIVMLNLLGFALASKDGLVPSRPRAGPRRVSTWPDAGSSLVEVNWDRLKHIVKTTDERYGALGPALDSVAQAVLHGDGLQLGSKSTSRTLRPTITTTTALKSTFKPSQTSPSSSSSSSSSSPRPKPSAATLPLIDRVIEDTDNFFYASVSLGSPSKVGRTVPSHRVWS